MDLALLLQFLSSAIGKKAGQDTDNDVHTDTDAHTDNDTKSFFNPWAGIPRDL